MPRQGSLFDGVGTHPRSLDNIPGIGSSIFDPSVNTAERSARIFEQGSGSAQRSAMVFMQNQQRQFALPVDGPGPRKQQVFDFSAPKMSMRSRMMAGGKMAFKKGNVLFELALMPAVMLGGAISGAGQWGSATGLEEDYVGGAVYGGVRGSGGALGGAVGSIAGGFVGGAVGTIFGPIGTTLGFLAGTVAGTYIGESLGGSILQDPARKAGLAARAIVKTARATDRIQFGGNFVDSRAAHTMRQRAVSDMSGSMMNARQFLGNEAIFLHG